MLHLVKACTDNWKYDGDRTRKKGWLLVLSDLIGYTDSYGAAPAKARPSASRFPKIHRVGMVNLNVLSCPAQVDASPCLFGQG